jgi:hypothetical protein
MNDYERTDMATEANRQRKYQRWSVEMREHGWDVREPTPRKVRALALHFGQKRREAAREAAND